MHCSSSATNPVSKLNLSNNKFNYRQNRSLTAWTFQLLWLQLHRQQLNQNISLYSPSIFGKTNRCWHKWNLSFNSTSKNFSQFNNYWGEFHQLQHIRQRATFSTEEYLVRRYCKIVHSPNLCLQIALLIWKYSFFAKVYTTLLEAFGKVGKVV